MDGNDEAAAGRRVLGCLLLASLQGMQNTNTPAPHSALDFVLLFFFNLKFLIFDIGICKYVRKSNLLIRD